MSTLSGTYQSRAIACLRGLGGGALVLLLGAPPTAAQEPEDELNARTEKIASTYRLTEPVLKKYAAAMRELLALARRDPSVLGTGDSDSSEAVHPAIKAIFTRAGLSEDELEKISIAMGFAAMGSWAAGLSREGAQAAKDAPPVVRANMAFLKTHEATLKAMESDLKELKRLQDRKAGVAAEAESPMELKVTGDALAEVKSDIELEVTGGRHAGRYTAKVTEGGCSYGLVKEGAWGNQYSITTEDPKKFSSLQLIVPDAKAAAGGTENFDLMVSFGPLLSLTGRGGTHYTGEGTVRVQDPGSVATVTFDAKSEDGVRLKGTIKCHNVMRMQR